MNIHVQFGFNHIVVSEKKAFEHFPIGSNVNLCLDGPLQTLRFLFRYEIQNGGYGRT
jgi:hypothetical protein